MAAREHINEWFNGQPFMLLCALALVVATAIGVAVGVQPVASGSTGIFFTLRDTLIGNGVLSAAVNVLCLLAAGGIMLAMNKVFSYVRMVTRLLVSAFFLLQLAHPAGLVSFNMGTLMCLVTALAIMPLFAAYQDHHSQRSIFLIFAIAAAGSMFHCGFLILMPAFLLGFFNMGVMNFKGVLAMLFGLITPFWIVLGLGIVAPGDFRAPHLGGIWNAGWTLSEGLLLIVAGATAVLGIVLAVMNLMTLMNYRMQTRVYNAFFVFMLVMAVIAICLDYRNTAIYLPLLNMMVAVQIAHTHTLRTSVHYRYVFMLLLACGCVAVGVAQLMMK